MFLLIKVAGSLAAVYLGVVVLLTAFQDRLLFPRWAMGPDAPPPSAEHLKLDLDSGATLIGVYLPAPVAPRETTSLLLGFGGNAWSANQVASYLRAVFPDRGIVAFHYRGYAPSTGKPSARALLQDAPEIHDHVVARLAPDRIVAVGFSIGAGPAVHLARSRPVAGLILVSPFDTLKALARDQYPWLPVGLLLRHHMDVAGDLARVSAPVAVIAAAEDTIVPPPRTEAVRRSAKALVLDRTIANAGHNDIYDMAEFQRALRKALAVIEKTGESGWDKKP